MYVCMYVLMYCIYIYICIYIYYTYLKQSSPTAKRRDPAPSGAPMVPVADSRASTSAGHRKASTLIPRHCYFMCEGY